MRNVLHSKLLLFLELCLTSMSLAVPLGGDLSVADPGNALKYGSGGSIVGFVVLILDLIVFSMSHTSFLANFNRPNTYPLLYPLLKGIPA